jgi:hypothetical protein
MHGHHETGKPQAIRGIRAIRGGRAAFGLWFGLFGSRMLVAQNEPAKTANQAVFTQQPARPAESVPEPHRRQYTFPENECSANFWNPYGQQASAITQSPARVQQSSIEQLAPGETVQELPDEVVDPAETVQQLADEVVEPAQRLQQMDDEVVRGAPAIEEPPGERIGGKPRTDDRPYFSLDNLWPN